MIEFIAETGSTNADLAGRLASGEAPREGEWLVADRQTAGRGRRGREWHDGAGNFMGSTIVHLRPGDPPAPSLALAAGVALHETVRPLVSAEHSPLLKWPNDLMLGIAKLGGILLEGAGRAVIVGIGVNLRGAPALPDRETAALADHGTAPDRDAFARALAENFAAELVRWRDFGLAPLIRRWLAAAHPPGTPLRIEQPGEAPLAGAFAGLGPEGHLRLRLEDGSDRVIPAGEAIFANESEAHAAGH